ncbi:MAG: hypothetical protein WCY33_06370 [Clostridia bacterium]
MLHLIILAITSKSGNKRPQIIEVDRKYCGWGEEKKELEIVKSGNSIGGNKRETEYDAGYIEAICTLCKKPLWLAARIVLSDDNPLKEQENELIESRAYIVMKHETQPQTFLTNTNNGARMFSVFTSLEAGRDYVDNCQSKR